MNNTDIAIEEYAGKVENVIYYDEKTGFTVMSVKIGHDFSVVKCTLPIRISDDQAVQIKGFPCYHKKYGKQINATSVELKDPTTKQGILAYLSSGIITGIGHSTAERICEAFGEQSLAILDETPERLLEIKGIGHKTLEKIVACWKEKREGAKITAELCKIGLSLTFALKTYKKYEGAALQVVKENPYRLAEEITGIGFKIADDVAKSLGYTQDHPFRVSAGIIHTLKESQSAGHCYLPEDKLLKLSGAILGISSVVVSAALDNLLHQRKLFRRPPEAFSQDVPASHAYYLKKTYLAERAIEKRLEAAKSLGESKDLQIALDQLLSQEQYAAAEAAVTGRVTLITGAAGTGKTTTLRAIIKCLESNFRSYCLCAPTGKAAKRMEEVTGRQAQTIHRLIGLGKGNGFQKNADNPLESEYVICDESSMIDLFLMETLVAALPYHGRIIFLGDPFQLQPVSAGSPFSDLITSSKFTVARLTQIHRQDDKSFIIKVANQIKDNIMPPIPNSRDVYFFEIESPDKLSEIVVDLSLHRIQSKFDIPFSDILILSPMKKGVIGVDNLNLMIQNRIHQPDVPQLKNFKLGDRVRQTVNDYNSNVFNGDSGIITHIDTDEKLLYVAFDGIEESIVYNMSTLDNLTLNYCSSIHSAQGSEARAIITVISTSHAIMLRSNLLYTAATRARELLVFCGTKKALSIGVMQKDDHKRHTSLFKLRGPLWA